MRLEEPGPAWPIPEDLVGAITELGEGRVAADMTRVHAGVEPAVSG